MAFELDLLHKACITGDVASVKRFVEARCISINNLYFEGSHT